MKGSDAVEGIGRLAVIGGGRMGEAIVGGLIASGAMAPGEIVVAEPVAARRDVLASEYGIGVVSDAAEALSCAGTVLLAVKPQVIDAVTQSISDAVAPGALVVSIAAGVSCARLESRLPAGTAVVRVMPNTPALVGAGMSVVSGGAEATPSQVEAVCELFSAIGFVVMLPESQQNAATAISGSGPAYVAMFVDALARAGVRHGLPRDVAEELAVRTVSGTAALLEGTGQHPEQLVDGVSSPGGTTIAAIEALEAGGFRASIGAAVAAAVARARELEG
jgi:pyrroline-5-carboxylate reductase